MPTAGMHGEAPLNIDLGINNERQDCTTGSVAGEVLVRGWRVNGGDEGEGIWLMGFKYIYEIENETSCNCSDWEREEV
jgi:hypothetical protein